VLTGSGGDLTAYAINQWLKWLRISDFFSPRGGYSFYGLDGYATYDDIVQGSIGNCWLMAAISAIAENPGYIERVFGAHAEESYINAYGFYDVNLFMLGAPITVRIDDYVPTYNSYTVTLFSKMFNRGVWVSVLEKAFAKLNGNYSALVGGYSEQAINTMLGTPQ
jgi:hypothetical protein